MAEQGGQRHDGEYRKCEEQRGALDLLEQRFHGERRLHTECDGGSTTAVAASPTNFVRHIGVLQKIGPGILAVYSTVGRPWAPAQGFCFAGIAQIAPLLSLL